MLGSHSCHGLKFFCVFTCPARENHGLHARASRLSYSSACTMRTCSCDTQILPGPFPFSPLFCPPSGNASASYFRVTAVTDPTTRALVSADGVIIVGDGRVFTLQANGAASELNVGFEIVATHSRNFCLFSDSNQGHL